MFVAGEINQKLFFKFNEVFYSPFIHTFFLSHIHIFIFFSTPKQSKAKPVNPNKTKEVLSHDANEPK